MSAIPIRTIYAKLDRNVAPATGEAFAGVPLTVVGSLPDEQTFEGIEQVYAELHGEEGLIAANNGSDWVPTGQSVVLTFDSATMQLSASKYSLIIYAVYPESRVEILRVIELHLYGSVILNRSYVYWGVSEAEFLDAADVLALGNSALNTSRAQSFTVDGGGKYIYFACPQSFGQASFAVFGFPTVGWIESQVSIQREGGGLVPYNVYRTPAVQAGSDIEITVS